MARYLAFVQRLALLTPIAGCASTPPPATSPSTVAPAPSPMPSSEPTNEPVSENSTCRWSWDTVATAAPRVCKKGELNYQGQVCAPASHPKWNGPVKGPLPPPDLPSV